MNSETKNLVFAYLLEAVDSSDFEGENPVSDWEKWEFVEKQFSYTVDHRPKDYLAVNLIKLFAGWIAGLPASFNIDFETHVIFDLGKKWGLIDGKTSDKKLDDWLEGWFPFIAGKFYEWKTELEKNRPLSAEANEVLKACTIEGNMVKMPTYRMDRELYLQVKEKLELIGGKYKTGKNGGFLFQSDPTDLVASVVAGEGRNLKKEFQFFGTPLALAQKLVKLADIQPSDAVLEPSAGQGAILRALFVNNVQFDSVSFCEMMPTNIDILQKNYGGFKKHLFLHPKNDDFLNLDDCTFNKIVANPPFAKNQDIDHIRKMYSLLRPGGRVVSMASVHWINSSNKKETEFRAWLESLGATWELVPAGEFKESGTGVPTSIITIDKPVDLLAVALADPANLEPVVFPVAKKTGKHRDQLSIF